MWEILQKVRHFSRVCNSQLCRAKCQNYAQAAEQVVGADNSRVSLSVAACNTVNLHSPPQCIFCYHGLCWRVLASSKPSFVAAVAAQLQRSVAPRRRHE